VHSMGDRGCLSLLVWTAWFRRDSYCAVPVQAVLISPSIQTSAKVPRTTSVDRGEMNDGQRGKSEREGKVVSFYACCAREI
jgi:hypothetical protein